MGYSKATQLNFDAYFPCAPDSTELLTWKAISMVHKIPGGLAFSSPKDQDSCYLANIWGK